ncbi:MAG: LURP-one-related family protein [Clostridiales bacterium]|nr:LURP-one-related family protein [Lachnospiraceae bacterium]MBR5058620.1 LURP-one-related family protein [Clostridiales bacterium]
MGIGSMILSKVAKTVALDAATTVYDKASEKVQKKTEKKIQKYLQDDSAAVQLVVCNSRDTSTKSYCVYDRNKNEKYQIKGKLSSRSPHLTIVDRNGNKLASVKEKRIAFRSPLSLEEDPKDYILEIGGKKIGVIKSQDTRLLRKFEFCFNHWEVKGNVLKMQYVINNGKEIILTVNDRAPMEMNSDYDCYYLDIYRPENELIGLAIATALDIASTS